MGRTGSWGNAIASLSFFYAGDGACTGLFNPSMIFHSFVLKSKAVPPNKVVYKTSNKHISVFHGISLMWCYYRKLWFKRYRANGFNNPSYLHHLTLFAGGMFLV